MTDRELQAHPLSGTVRGGAGTEGNLITGSSTRGAQSFAIAPGDQIRIDTAAHKRRQEQIQLDHDLTERAKDNRLRRICFGIIVGVLVLALGVATVIAFAHQEPGTKQWAQGIVTTLVGGLIGGLAGYLTGRGGG